MGKKALIAGCAALFALTGGAAHARADNARPGDEERVELRTSSAAQPTPAETRLQKQRHEKRRKRRYPLM